VPEGSKQVSTKQVEYFYEFRRQVKTDEQEEEGGWKQELPRIKE